MKIKKYITENTLTKKKIEVKEINDKLFLISKSQGPTSRLILKNEIEVDDNFWFALGLFAAERTKDKQRLAVTNSDPYILRKIIKLFEIIGINKNTWKGVVSSNSYYIRNLDEFKINARKYWSKELGIPEEKILITTYYRKPSRIRNSIPFGTMQLRIQSIILTTIIENMINSLLLEKN